MSKKILKLYKPQLTGLNYLISPLAIIPPETNYQDWIYSEYIQIMIRKDIPYITFTKKYPLDIPCIDFRLLDKELLHKCIASIHTVIKESIDLGWYINSDFNEYYIPKRFAYLNYNFIHDFLLFGYDEEAKEYYIAGYDTSMKYNTQKISFEAFELAFCSCYGKFELLKPNVSFNFSIDRELIINDINSYLNSNNICGKHFILEGDSKRWIFGQDALSTLRKFILQGYDSDNPAYKKLSNYTIINYQNNCFNSIQLVYEHKKLLVNKINYLIRRGVIKDNTMLVTKAKELEDQALLLRNIYIKYSINEKDIMLDKLDTCFENIINFEKVVFDLLISSLK